MRKYPIKIIIGRFQGIFGKIRKTRSSHSKDSESLNKQKICPISYKEHKYSYNAVVAFPPAEQCSVWEKNKMETEIMNHTQKLGYTALTATQQATANSNASDYRHNRHRTAGPLYMEHHPSTTGGAVPTRL